MQDIQTYKGYLSEMQANVEEEKNNGSNAMFAMQPKRPSYMNEDLPELITKKTIECENIIRAILRLMWRKHYEYMMPILRYGNGKSFGELAVQKEQNVKLANKPKPRAATVICRTRC